MPRARRVRTDAVQSPLETYLREINETALLTADEEKELARRIQDGDGEARDRMVRANLRLVVSIARAYAGRGLGLQDLIEEGNLGLLRAVEGFDPDMNTRFSTYAGFWIKQSIRRALLNTCRTIRIPSYMVDLLNKWRVAVAQLQEELGRTPTPDEVGRRLNLPRRKLAILKKAVRVYKSMTQADPSQEGLALEDTLMDPGAPPPDFALAEAEDQQQVLEVLARMDRREATVLRMRYGLDENGPRTLREIGDHLGLTRERVRQIEKDALNKLSETLQLE